MYVRVCVCFCECGKFTSASIGERLHPRHASSLSGQERGWRAKKKMGRALGGRAGRGAWTRGQRLGRLIWVGGLGIKPGSGVGVGRLGGGGRKHPNLMFPPFLLHTHTHTLSFCACVSLVVPLSSLHLSPSACVSQRFPWRPGGRCR